MLIRELDEVERNEVEVEGAEGVYIRWLISEETGAPNFAMREFTIEAGGRTPYHSHDWEHEVYVLAGNGTVVSEEEETQLLPGSVVFVPGGEMHNFKNAGAEPFRFLCLVPLGAK